MAHGGAIGTEEGLVHLPAIAVISPGDPGGPEIFANCRLALGVKVTLLDLVPLRIVGARDAGGAEPFAFGRATVVIEVGFDNL